MRISDWSSDVCSSDLVEVRTTQATVEGFHRGTRVASHRRSTLKRCHTTIPEHMPSAHRRYAAWTPARLLAAAKAIGAATEALCAAIMRAKPHPEQGLDRKSTRLNSSH